MPDADGEYCRIHDSLPWCIAVNALEYTEVPLIVPLPWVLLLMQDTQGGPHIKNILLHWCCSKSAKYCKSKFYLPSSSSLQLKMILCLKVYQIRIWDLTLSAETSKTGPLHIFCLLLEWDLSVFTSTDMIQPSPQLNRVSGGTTCSNLRSWQFNLTAVYAHRVFQLHLTATYTLLGELTCIVYMIISSSWHGATSVRLWYASCSYSTMCCTLCPLFQVFNFMCCVVLCHICCCCGVAAPCVAAIMTVRMNQKNFSEASLSWISTVWFILVSLLLLKSNFVCVCVCVHIPISSFKWFPSFLVNTRGT